MGLRETKVLKELLELKDLLVWKEDKDPLDPQENLVKRVKLVFLAFRDQLEEMGFLDQEAYPVSLVLKVTLEKMVSKEKLDLLEAKASKVLKERLDLSEVRDLGDKEVKWDPLDHLGTKDLRD